MAGDWLCCLGASAQDKEQGSCDVSAQREKRTLEYNVEDRNDTDSTFVSKTPCTGEAIAIKRCAVIEVRHKKIQRFCRLPNKPTYFEYFDVVEYWDIATPK
jgi:hypothetical protein